MKKVTSDIAQSPCPAWALTVVTYVCREGRGHAVRSVGCMQPQAQQLLLSLLRLHHYQNQGHPGTRPVKQEAGAVPGGLDERSVQPNPWSALSARLAGKALPGL